MKKILPLLLLLGCTNEALEPTTECFCEKVIYLEAKYQNESDGSWNLKRTVVKRVAVACQSETDFTPTGEVLESFRIECT